ncbi:MAG: GlsB/YeaQ/YmgE family stress response membrane protein [Lapillicoccus sp.]
MSIIGSIIFGAIIGALARLVLPGRQNVSVLMTILIGIVGAVVGYFIASALGVGATDGIDWIRWIISIVVAALGIVAYGALTGRRQT